MSRNCARVVAVLVLARISYSPIVFAARSAASCDHSSEVPSAWVCASFQASSHPGAWSRWSTSRGQMVAIDGIHSASRMSASTTWATSARVKGASRRAYSVAVPSAGLEAGQARSIASQIGVNSGRVMVRQTAVAVAAAAGFGVDVSPERGRAVGRVMPHPQPALDDLGGVAGGERRGELLGDLAAHALIRVGDPFGAAPIEVGGVDRLGGLRFGLRLHLGVVDEFRLDDFRVRVGRGVGGADDGG